MLDSALVILDAGVSRDATHPTDAAVDADRRTPPEVVGEMEHWFDDVTVASGVTIDRVSPGGFDDFANIISGGVCVLDVDHQPPMDLFFALRPWDTGGSALFVGSAPLRFRDETALRGLSDVGDAIGCLAFDADGDADDDLLVTGRGGIRLFLQEDGTFVDATPSLHLDVSAGTAFTTAVAADFDGDLDLDLLVAADLDYDPGSATPGCARCPPDGRTLRAAPNLLLIRGADGEYRDHAAELAPVLAISEPTLVVQAVDLNGDGAADILEGNDYGTLYPNRALVRDSDGVFRDRGFELGLDRNRRGFRIDSMGISTGDIDRDGYLDHVFSSFEFDATAVFSCSDGRAPCVDRALEVGTLWLAGSVRWGLALMDFDLDGWLDLVEATGHVWSDATLVELGRDSYMDQFPNLMASNGDGTLRPIAPTPDDGRAVRRSLRGIAITDLDEDGQPDVVFAPAIGSPLLLRTVRPRVGHYLRVTLAGRSPNTGAIGAKVTIHAGAQVYVRQRLAGEGYLGNFDPRLFFGIAESGPVSIDVRWPGGAVTTLTDIALDRDLTITEP